MVFFSIFNCSHARSCHDGFDFADFALDLWLHCSVAALYVLCELVSRPSMSRNSFCINFVASCSSTVTLRILMRLMPLAACFVANVALGVAALADTSVPLFTALRRGTALLMLAAEYWVLGIVPTRAVSGSVLFMCMGAIVAVIGDSSAAGTRPVFIAASFRELIVLLCE